MTSLEKGIFDRGILLLGNERMERIMQKRVILFGVGGVGSWCAESLVRSGISHITLVDSDCVCASNCNRQLMATTKTIGRPKVEALKERLLEINPDADIVAMQNVYNEENAESYCLDTYDFIIDAIDSLREKAHLIKYACNIRKRKKGEGMNSPVLLCSMGAALRIDPTKVKVAEFWNIKGDALARALRNRFKKEKDFPASKFLCVYSEETPLQNIGAIPEGHTAADKAQAIGDWNERKVHTNGSLSHITGIFGMTLAGLALKEIE